MSLTDLFFNANSPIRLRIAEEVKQSQSKKKNMKTKKGTAAPPPNGVGKGGSPQSPTDGKSLKVKKGSSKKKK